AARGSDGFGLRCSRCATNRDGHARANRVDDDVESRKSFEFLPTIPIAIRESEDITQYPVKTELGLLPRLVAAGWFGVTASIPVVFFFITFGAIRQNGPIDLKVLFFFG